LIFLGETPGKQFGLKNMLLQACGRAIRSIFLLLASRASAYNKKDAAVIPFAGQKYVQKTTYKTMSY
jgi:hypothetical protein